MYILSCHIVSLIFEAQHIFNFSFMVFDVLIILITPDSLKTQMVELYTSLAGFDDSSLDQWESRKDPGIQSWY